jgi:hypothetical protein
MASDQKPTCFVIAPIGDKDSDIRKRSDKALKHIFKRALADKYSVIRADDITEPGMITSQVLQAVQDSDLVLADLTGHNPNVFYELAVRHAIEKPIIHLIERPWKIPFDVGGFRTIDFDLTDPDSIESAVEELRKQAAQAAAGKWGETPVKLANVMRRTEGDSPQMLLLKQAVEGISNVSARLTSVEEIVRAKDSPDYVWNTADLAGSYAAAARVFKPYGEIKFSTAPSGSAPFVAPLLGTIPQTPLTSRPSVKKRAFGRGLRRRGSVAQAPPKPDSEKKDN